MSVCLEEKEDIELFNIDPIKVVAVMFVSESKCFIFSKPILCLNRRSRRGLYPKLENYF